MRLLILLFIMVLVSCTNRQETINYQHVLEASQARADQAKSLSEDTLLCQALEYYQALEPKDSARLSQAIILTAQHYWWNGEKGKAYELLHTISEKNKKALYTLFLLASRDYDYEACYEYLTKIMQDETGKSFENYQALAALYFYLDRPKDCERLFDNITQYIRTPQDSALYWEQVLPNHADIISDYGNQDKAIQLQNQVLHHFIEGKDSLRIAFSYASLSRYHLLKDDINNAERFIQLAKEYAPKEIHERLYFSSYMELLQSILNYAKERRINIMEWANFTNSLNENSYIRQAISDAKEENNRLLIERNLRLTIDKQRTQISFIYVAIGLLTIIGGLTFYIRKRKRQIEEKDEELEALRQLVNESQHPSGQKDDRFFKRILLQQLGVIQMAASNPTTANQELIRRMSQIANKEVEVDSLLNWKDLYKTIDYIYDDFYTHLIKRYASLLNEKEIQLCCLLKTNFSTKEISVVSQQSVRTVYQRKSVIRQKLGIEEKGDIIEFLD